MPDPPVPEPPTAHRGRAPQRDRRAAGRWWRQGLAPALVGLLLGLLSLPGPGLLTVGVAALQVLLVLTLLVLLDAPARTGATVIALAAAVATDVVVLRGDGRVDGLAGVIALSLVAALLHQLSRRRSRTHVTFSLVDTMVAVVLVAAAGCLTALRDEAGSRPAVLAALLAAAAGRLVSCGPAAPLQRSPRQRSPLQGPAGRRSAGARKLLLGLVAVAGVGTVVGSVVAALGSLSAGNHLSAGRGALVGLAAAVGVALSDRFVGIADIQPGPGARRRAAALRTVAVLLPYAALGPLALVAGRLALG